MPVVVRMFGFVRIIKLYKHKKSHIFLWSVCRRSSLT